MSTKRVSAVLARVGALTHLWVGLSLVMLLLTVQCSNVERAATLLDGEGGSTSRNAAGAGGESVSNDEASAMSTGAAGGTSAASAAFDCSDFPPWLDYTWLSLGTVSTAGLVLQIELPFERLVVDSSCNYFVQRVATSSEVRSGVLDEATARALWEALGSEARSGLSGEQNLLGLGDVRTLADPSATLVCRGDCTSPAVSEEAAALFQTASDWVERLYGEASRFDGSLLLNGVPSLDSSLAALPWPLEGTLTEFFASSVWSAEGGIDVDGDDAALLRTAMYRAEAAQVTFGSVVLFEDETGVRYVVLLRESAAALR